MEILAFAPEHLNTLAVQAAQAGALADRDKALKLISAGQAFSARTGGATLAVAGVVEQWPGRALAWAVLSQDIGRHMVAVHRAVVRFLELAPYRRIEMHVDAKHEQGKRWAEMLGFEYEGYERAYAPDGRDCLLYARVQR